MYSLKITIYKHFETFLLSAFTIIKCIQTFFDETMLSLHQEEGRCIYIDHPDFLGTCAKNRMGLIGS